MFIIFIILFPHHAPPAPPFLSPSYFSLLWRHPELSQISRVALKSSHSLLAMNQLKRAERISRWETPGVYRIYQQEQKQDHQQVAHEEQVSRSLFPTPIHFWPFSTPLPLLPNSPAEPSLASFPATAATTQGPREPAQCPPRPPGRSVSPPPPPPPPVPRLSLRVPTRRRFRTSWTVCGTEMTPSPSSCYSQNHPRKQRQREKRAGRRGRGFLLSRNCSSVFSWASFSFPLGSPLSNIPARTKPTPLFLKICFVFKEALPEYHPPSSFQ